MPKPPHPSPSPYVHPSAWVHPDVALPPGLSIGPYAVVEPGVTFGRDCTVGPFAVLHAGSHLGQGVRLDAGVVVGGEPQDLKYRGETSTVRIGDETRLREYVTVNRGTAADGGGAETIIGSHCLVMAYAHVAHDCRIGNGVVVANGVQMGGHVKLGDASVISGMTGIHQFVCVGAGAFVGGGLRIDKDVLPGTKALGEPVRWGGLNPQGWERLGYPREALAFAGTFYRQLRAPSRLAGDWRERFAALKAGLRSEEALPPEWLSRLEQLFEGFFAVTRRGLVLRGEVESAG